MSSSPITPESPAEPALPSGGRLTVRAMEPSIFAIVMATGIVSIAITVEGLGGVDLGLFWLNILLYGVLWVLFGLRCIRHGDWVLADMHDHGRAPGFFTLVAATCIVGNECVVHFGAAEVGMVLWLIALGLWLVLTYRMLPWLMEDERKPPLERALNGGWLLAVVATQALCVLACRVAQQLAPTAAEVLLFAALACWLIGGMLYIWLIALIFYRVLFLPLSAGGLTPPYWINMGAMAISTLAGVFLADQAHRLPVLVEILPFIKGLTLMFWATATWWIPMLLSLEGWRYLRKHFPLGYDNGFWAVVFPLGMYTVATQELTRHFRLPFLQPVATVFGWVALVMWALTFIGLLLHLRREGAFARLRRPIGPARQR